MGPRCKGERLEVAVAIRSSAPLRFSWMISFCGCLRVIESMRPAARRGESSARQGGFSTCLPAKKSSASLKIAQRGQP
jgi:hypothetical protein